MEVAKVSENKSSNSLPRFPLNYDCMYEVFKRLPRLEECMNLAESYEGLQCVADKIYKMRYGDISINFLRLMDIDRIMNHIGPFIKSLELLMFNKFQYTDDDLVKIQLSCQQLKILSIIGFDRSGHKTNPFSGYFSTTLETLKLTSCSFDHDYHFFKSFTIRKSLTMINCVKISSVAMHKCFEQNQQIESFACNSRTIEYAEFLDVLPNLQRLALVYERRISRPTILSRLKSLRTLALHCLDENINDVLSLATIEVKRNLEEMELAKVVPNGRTFKLLAEFSALRRLIITTNNDYKISSTDKFPPKLKTLKLSGFHICKRRLVQLIEQQKQIEKILLADCNLTSICGFDPMVKLIAQKCDAEERKIHLTLTISDDVPSTAMLRSGNFLVTGYLTNPDEFKIIFE